jgi:hypothetical protein
MKINQNLKARLYKFYDENIDKGKSFVANHFLAEGCSRSTIYRHIRSRESGKQLERKKGSGRIPIISTPKNRARIAKMFNHKMKGSLRKAAKKFKCSHETIRGILQKMKKPILCYKRKKRPNRTPVQRLVARPKCKRLLQTYRDSDFILDDESYFTLSNSTLSGNDTYYSNDRTLTPDDVKHHDKSKYEPKVLVWLAISTKGISQIHIRPSAMAINQEVYLNECIIKRLVPFINKYHSDGNYVFWPDLASSHYAYSVTDWLEEQKIPFVPKDMNPANLPEARPIEDFWAILKRDVYMDGWTADNVDKLESRIRYCLRKIDVKVVQ